MKRWYEISIKATCRDNYFIVSYEEADGDPADLQAQIVDKVKTVIDDDTLWIGADDGIVVSGKINNAESYGDVAVALIDIEEMLKA